MSARFLQTLIEALIANIGITGLVLVSLLANLAGDATFQTKLCAEVAALKTMKKTTRKNNDGASTNIADYAAKQDGLLHYLTLESVRLVPHVRKC